MHGAQRTIGGKRLWLSVYTGGEVDLWENQENDTPGDAVDPSEDRTVGIGKVGPWGLAKLDRAREGDMCMQIIKHA